MKKLILTLGLLCLPLFASAGDIRVVLPDSIAVADTNAARVDTAYSSWVSMAGAQKLQFYTFLRPPAPPATDTNFVNDTFFVDIELSFDKIVVSKLFLVDTMVTTDSGWAGVADDKADLLAADSLRGNWMRARVVHRAPDMACPGCVNNNYGKIVTVYYSIVK
jgi:hypothetical protein